MMIQYAVNISDISFAELEPFCSLLSRYKQEKAAKYIFDADKIRCVAGELMLRYIVTADYGVDNEDICITCTDTGKPYFIGHAANIYFNISHSHDFVVCAVGDFPVGIDVEHVKDKEAGLASYVLSESENLTWSRLPEEVRNHEFYRYWTIKESYSKYVGQGLGIEFSEITAVNVSDNLWKIIQDEKSYIMSQKLSDLDYLAVCIDGKYQDQLEPEVKMLNTGDLVGFGKRCILIGENSI